MKEETFNRAARLLVLLWGFGMLILFLTFTINIIVDDLQDRELYTLEKELSELKIKKAELEIKNLTNQN